MQYPTLSVIMSNYNHARFLPTALEAILSQSYQPKEVIIVDDASSDNSVEILESYAAKYNIIRLIRNEKNLGLFINGQRLLEYASCDYVYGAAADDKVLPKFFEKSMCLLKQYPQAGLCSALALRMNMNGENIGLDYLPIVSRRPVYFSSVQCKKMICKYNNWIHSTATIYRRNALLAAGGLIPELHSYSDVFAGLVIALCHGVCYIPEPLTTFRITGNNYCITSMGNRENAIEIIGNVVKLMNSTYAGLFPFDYIEEMERVGEYTRILYSSPLTRSTEALLLPTIHKTFVSKSIYCILKPVLYSLNFLSKFYSFYYSGRSIYSTVLRRLKKIYHTLRLSKIKQIKI